MKIFFNNVKARKKDIIVILFLCMGILFTYLWTIDLPVGGDGLMHMADHTKLKTPMDWIQIFYQTGLEQGKAGYATSRFLRPIFNDILVTFLKFISNYDIHIIRGVTLFIHCINTCLAYCICKKLSMGNILISVCGACFVGFGLGFYSGIFEVGLSFSMWLTCFTLLAFLFLIYFLETKQIRFFILSIGTSFLAIFTKESAVTLGIALTIYMICRYIIDSNSVVKKHILAYGLCQAFLIVLYFACRFHKLGGFTNVAGGIEGEISLIDSIKKIIGYFLLSFNISNTVIESYMLPDIRITGLIFTIITIVLLCFMALAIIYNMIKSRQVFIVVLTAILMFVISISPTFKVTRNAPYYVDWSVISILVLITSLYRLQLNKKLEFIAKTIFSGSVICVIIINWFTLDYIWENNSTYLVQLEKPMLVLEEEISSSVPKYDTVYQGIGFNKDGNNTWIYNYSTNPDNYGGFYKYNIDKTANVYMATDKELDTIPNNAVVLDFAQNKNMYTDILVNYAAADNDNTVLLRVEVEQLESYENNLLILEYIYKDKNWIQDVDLTFTKQNGITELWFVLPKGVDYTITCDYVQSEEMLNWEDLQTRENDLQNMQIS